MIPSAILRGQIYFADLSEFSSQSLGANKPRPILIIQNDIGNMQSGEVIAARITSAVHKRKYPTQYDIFINTASRICLEDIITIKKDRLKSYIGRLTPEEMMQIDMRLATSLQLLLPSMIYQIEVLDILTNNRNQNDIFYDIKITLNNRQEMQLEISFVEFQQYFKEVKDYEKTNTSMIQAKLNTLRGLKFLDKYLYQERYRHLY